MNWLAYVVFSLAAVYLVLLIVTKIIKTVKDSKKVDAEPLEFVSDDPKPSDDVEVDD